MSNHLEEPARSSPQRWPIIVAFALIWGGLMSTEQLSIHLLPTTIEEFTNSPWLIGVILALNPAFGVIAQPIAGILGDKIWTPVGRRAFFLITGAPIVGLCLWLIPEARLLWHIVVLVLLYQLFQDVMWGSDHPLMADLFPPKQRLFVSGMLITAGNLTGWIFMKFGMGNLNSGNLSSDELYRLVAILQVVLVAGLSFFLNEKPVVKKDRPKLTLKRYATDLLGHPIRRRFAAL
ncbi:MAG: MFS transporter [Opitutales bacterium]|jgi:MFS family permease|nr:MFS transporter [Opitutales bacterium]